jgi:glycosyltransferase involved in cell wall biosynthesis
MDPRVSFVIPTLNAEAYLDECLSAIRSQEYPQHLVEIVIADGGSSDATRSIAARHGATVVDNPGRTAEAGKAVGLAAASGSIVAFVDSDNEIIGADWLRRMVRPFDDDTVVSSETLRWAYVREDGIVNRYCALTGINDPTSLFVGNYGRWSWLTGRWTDYPVVTEERDDWIRVVLDPRRVPTMGANGYLVRADAIRSVPGVDRYMFDIDVVQQLAELGHRTVARVDTEIRHKFARNTRDYARKTRRRAQDYLHHRRLGERAYGWPRGGIVRFVLATVLVLPVLAQSAVGYRRRPDLAWLYHPVACGMTLFVYAEAVIRSRLRRGAFDRSGWTQ